MRGMRLCRANKQGEQGNSFVKAPKGRKLASRFAELIALKRGREVTLSIA